MRKTPRFGPTVRSAIGPAGTLQWAELLRVVNILPGRMRLRFKALKGCPDTAGTLQSHLGSVDGISRVEISPLTGSLLLHYDPQALSSPEFLDAFSEAMGKAFPGRFAPGRLHLTFNQLKGNSAFTDAVTKRLSGVPGIEQLEIDAATGACLLVYDSREVTKPAFIEEVSGPLEELMPGLNVKGLFSKAGFRPG